MQNKELNKYFSNDTVFNETNKKFISLQNNEVRKVNKYLKQVLETLTTHMKLKDSLFEKTYKNIIFCGSFYKGTKVGKPNEFDLNIVLELPINYKYIHFESLRPAFVQININNSYTSKYNDLSAQEKRLFQKLISQTFLNPNKFRSWIERIISVVINELPNNTLTVTTDSCYFNAKIKVKKSGPAFTIIINIPHEAEDIHIDLVPTLAFKTSTLQQFPSLFHRLQNYRNDEWFAVPVPLIDIHSNVANDLHWRLSFSLQENEILSRYGRIKPVIRQMKKLRDTQNWKCIASYYIEILCFNKLKELEKNLDKISLTLLFFTILMELYYACKQHEIKYFWDDRYNLLGKIKQSEMFNIIHRLSHIIDDIEKNIMTDLFILSKYILNTDELLSLKKALDDQKYTECETKNQPPNRFRCIIS